MGIPEFFGTIQRNSVTFASILVNYSKKQSVKHFLLDFNSIIHDQSQWVISQVNNFLKLALVTANKQGNLKNDELDRLFKHYDKFESIKNQIEKDLKNGYEVNVIIDYFGKYFNDDKMDMMIIAQVIKDTKDLIETYCDMQLETLLIALDGVPSKGKMVEQRHRRFLGAMSEEIGKEILSKHKQDLEDWEYQFNKNKIKWARNKITPGTDFMLSLSKALRAQKSMAYLIKSCPNAKIILSDTTEVGEGEKKITNWVESTIPNSNDIIMFYSPDADVILLCMLLSTRNVQMLRRNQNAKDNYGKSIRSHDLIKIKELKQNIVSYVTDETDLEVDPDRMAYDLVTLSNVFGNDFIPKIETLSVKQGFQILMNVYLDVFKEHGYLVNDDEVKTINMPFFLDLIKALLPYEEDFIQNNAMYNKYITAAQAKYTFPNNILTIDTYQTVVTDFIKTYKKMIPFLMQGQILNPGFFGYGKVQKEFFDSLRKCIILDSINAMTLSNEEIMTNILNFYEKNDKLPRLNINTNTFGYSIDDNYHKRNVKDFNAYQIEMYQFDNLLDEYAKLSHHYKLNLSRKEIPAYYSKYFTNGVLEDGKLTKLGYSVVQEYFKGILWVFDNYYNSTDYVSTYYYPFDRAPLLLHLYQTLKKVNVARVEKSLDKNKVEKLKNYWNPIEQLIYVSPHTKAVIKLLPSEYRDFQPNKYICPKISTLVKEFYEGNEADCLSISYFTKCLIHALNKPTEEIDEEFFTQIRKIKSKNNIKSTIPKFKVIN